MLGFFERPPPERIAQEGADLQWHERRVVAAVLGAGRPALVVRERKAVHDVHVGEPCRAERGELARAHMLGARARQRGTRAQLARRLVARGARGRELAHERDALVRHTRRARVSVHRDRVAARVPRLANGVRREVAAARGGECSGDAVEPGGDICLDAQPAVEELRPARAAAAARVPPAKRMEVQQVQPAERRVPATGGGEMSR